MTEIRYSLLDDPLLTVRLKGGRGVVRSSICELYGMLRRDEVEDFPELRPHQRHVWHAFLVQVACLAMHAAGRRELPEDRAAWRELLLRMTPDDPDGAAWALVAPPSRPALLQPPVPEGTLHGFKQVLTADALDMLVSARNHDIKRRVMLRAPAELWLFALLSVQTQEGFLGAGNYGISRMNGGFSSRPGLGVAPPGGPGARVVRDVQVLLTRRGDLLSDHSFYPSAGGIGLLWLVPWDGGTSLSPTMLDPFYVEVCRRIRLTVREDGELQAWTTSTKKPRIDAGSLNGRTGDPWTPLIADQAARKALTLDAGGFSYRRLVPLLFPTSSDPGAPIKAVLQGIADDDAESGLSIIARGMVRGQGKTEGYHERRIPVSRILRRLLGPAAATDDVARIAAERVEDVGTFGRRVLYPTAMAIFTAAPSSGERARDDDTAKMRAGAVVRRFERSVDDAFFVDLERELELLGSAEAMQRTRGEWLLDLRDIGRQAVDDALAAAPGAALRRYRIAARVRHRFDRAFQQQFGGRIPLQTRGPAAAVPSMQSQSDTSSI